MTEIEELRENIEELGSDSECFIIFQKSGGKRIPECHIPISEECLYLYQNEVPGKIVKRSTLGAALTLFEQHWFGMQ